MSSSTIKGGCAWKLFILFVVVSMYIKHFLLPKLHTTLKEDSLLLTTPYCNSSNGFKSACSITNYLISSDSFDSEHCSSLLQKSLKKSLMKLFNQLKDIKWNSKRLCYWAGLTHTNNESAKKKKSVKISCARVYLKPALVQVAHAAVKSTNSPYYKSKRRGKKGTIIACNTERKSN